CHCLPLDCQKPEKDPYGTSESADSAEIGRFSCGTEGSAFPSPDRLKKRRNPKAIPVTTRTMVPAVARAATICPPTPPASPVCNHRAQVRRRRPELLLAKPSVFTTSKVFGSIV